MALFSKRGAGFGAILAAAASSLFGRQGGSTFSMGETIPGLSFVGNAAPRSREAEPANKRKPGCVASYRKKGPGRYARLGHARRPSRYWLFGWTCPKSSIAGYLHAAARRRWEGFEYDRIPDGGARVYG